MCTEDQTIKTHALSYTFTNIEHIPDDFLNVLTQISSKKYLISITLIFSKDFKLDTIALFDTGADLNCIKKRVVPKKIFQNTFEKLSTTRNSKLHIAGKLKPLFLTKASLLRHFLLLQRILMIPSVSVFHSLT